MATITGSINDDLLYGTDGVDTITGDAGNDYIDGGAGGDSIGGGGGNDTLFGGAGNDLMNGDEGSDLVDMGAGDDQYQLDLNQSGSDTVQTGAADVFDTVIVNGITSAQIRMTISADGAGNGVGTTTDGGLAVTIQGEAGAGTDNLFGQASRIDDESVFFFNLLGAGFDVRDVNGTVFGNNFTVVGFGGAGADVSTGARFESFFGATGGLSTFNDLYFAGQGNDSINGAAGNDVLYGQDGDDTLIGAAGEDRIIGGAGADFTRLNVATDGPDIIDLGEGADTVFLDNSLAGGNIRLTFDFLAVGDGNPLRPSDGGPAVRIQTANGGVLSGPISQGDDEGIDYVAALVGQTLDVVGTDGVSRGLFGNVRLGTSGNDVLPFRFNEATYYNGGLGDDILSGSDFNDFLEGGEGADSMFGGLGNDRFSGGNGNDYASGGDGNDAMDGDAGNDELFGGNGNDFLRGLAGADSLNGASGDDAILGGADNDVISGELGSDVLFGEAGNDTMLGGDGIDTLNGGQGDDALFGETGGDTLSGELGNDTLNGGEGNDVLIGGADQDLLVGEAADDILVGNDGNDQVLGGVGNDVLNGNAGDDILFGGADTDQVIGEAGNDIIIGGSGGDALVGGAGADVFVYQAAIDSVASNPDLILDFSRAQGDKIDVTGVDANSNTLIDDNFTLVSSFTGVAGQAQIFQIVVGGQARTVFLADTNGDGVGDFGFQVVGTVDGTDFFL